MNESSTDAADQNTIRKVIRVHAPPEVAWKVFTERMGTWWPLSNYKIGAARAVDAVIEPKVGGRWFERGSDGTTCDWGRVLVWAPPTRLILSWNITADWAYSAALQTEVEVRFIADGTHTTVELVHSKLDRYAERRDQIRSIFDSPDGWSGLLRAFVACVERG